MDPGVSRQPHSAEHFGDARDLWWHPDFLDLIARRVGLDQCRTMLDLGAGKGHWTALVAPRCAPDVAITAVDFEAEWIEALKQRFTTHPRFAAVAADLSGFSGPHDLVTCQTLLLHLPVAAVDRLLREAWRLLSPGGLLLPSSSLISQAASRCGHVSTPFRPAMVAWGLIRFAFSRYERCRRTRLPRTLPFRSWRTNMEEPGTTKRADAGAGAFRLFRPADNARALGLAVNHLMVKPAFANLRFGEWSRILVGQINRGHYAFATDGDGRIQGFIGWALATKEKAEAWVEGRRALTFQDSLEGDNLVFNAWSANSSRVHRFLVDEVRKIIKDKQTVYFKRYYKDGSTRPVRLTVNDFVVAHVDRKAAQATGPGAGASPETEADPQPIKR